MDKKRKLAGFFRQIRIISWKNILLFLQNKSGIITELITCSLFLLLIAAIVLTNVANKRQVPNEFYDVPGRLYISGGGGKIYYYPKSKLTDDLMPQIFKTIRDNADPYQYLDWESIDIADPVNFNNTQFNQTSIFISFPEEIKNATNWPDAIQYSLFIKNRYQTILQNDIFNFNLVDIPKYVTDSRILFKEEDESINTLKNAIDANLIDSVLGSNALINLNKKVNS